MRDLLKQRKEEEEQLELEKKIAAYNKKKQDVKDKDIKKEKIMK